MIETPAVMSPPTLWLDPSFGASGDMLLGAFAGLLGNTEPLTSLDGLGIDGFSIASSGVTRNGLAAQRVEVTASPGRVRHWSDIDALLAAAHLPEAVKAGARSTFVRLGEVEAEQHGVTLDEVHFHEVGAVDAIVDIVGAWLLLDALDPGDVIVGPVGFGHGTVTAAHGVLPLPAPATLALLTGQATRSLDVVGETCTPTGAALLATMATGWGPMPSGTIRNIARGAGHRNPTTHPNVLTAVTLSTAVAGDTAHVVSNGHEAVILHTNLDDVTPEVLAHTIERLLAAGADDAWLTAIVMKKSRPAHQLSVLTESGMAGTMRAIISTETGTLGIRQVVAEKFPLPRSVATVELGGMPVRIKSGPHGAKPEYDDLVAVAHATGRPLRLVSAEALSLWRDNPGG